VVDSRHQWLPSLRSCHSLSSIWQRGLSTLTSLPTGQTPTTMCVVSVLAEKRLHLSDKYGMSCWGTVEHRRHSARGSRHQEVPLPRNFFDFWVENSMFWYILRVIFCCKLVCNDQNLVYIKSRLLFKISPHFLGGGMITPVYPPINPPLLHLQHLSVWGQ